MYRNMNESSHVMSHQFAMDLSSVGERVRASLGAGLSGSPLKAAASQISLDVAGLLLGLRPACLLDYAPRCRPEHAVALLESLKATALDAFPGLDDIHCLRLGSEGACCVLLVNARTLRDDTDALASSSGEGGGRPTFVDVTRASSPEVVADPGTTSRTREELAKVDARVQRALEEVRAASGGSSGLPHGTVDVHVPMDWRCEGGCFGPRGDACGDGDDSGGVSQVNTPLPTVLGFLLGYPAVYTFDPEAADLGEGVGGGEPVRVYRVGWRQGGGAALQFSVPEVLAGRVEAGGAWAAWMRRIRGLGTCLCAPAYDVVDDGRRAVL